MTAPTHTPGPWYAMTGDTGGIVDQANVFSEHETDGEPTFIADTMPVDDEVPLEQRKANAHIIAAGLEMLSALRRAYSFILCNGYDKQDQALLNEVAGAIGKAEGRALIAEQREKP